MTDRGAVRYSEDMLFDGFFRALFAEKPFAKAAGDRGEEAAARFLKKRGMKIAARNFRSGRHEADIVAFDGECAVFVEVKTRSENALVDGYYAAVTKSKRRGIRICANRFLSRLRPRPASWRYDVVDVRIGEGMKILQIRHFENIPL